MNISRLISHIISSALALSVCGLTSCIDGEVYPEQSGTRPPEDPSTSGSGSGSGSGDSGDDDDASGEDSGAETDDSGGTDTDDSAGDETGETGEEPDLCEPGEQGSCMECIKSTCCNALELCFGDMACLCAFQCVSMGGEVMQCNVDCGVDGDTMGVTELFTCLGGACNADCS